MRLLLRRLLREGAWTLGLLAGASLLVFLIVRAAPGDAGSALGLREGPGRRGNVLADYTAWVAAAARGDFGASLRTGRPVSEEIRRVGPNTLALSLGALAVAVGVAVPIGVAGALRRHSPLAGATTVAAYALSALPAFFVGYVAIYFFTRRLQLFPLAFGGDGRLPWLAFVLPMTVLGVANGGVGEVVRHVRAALERVLAEEYVRTARAKGAPVWRHAAAEGLLLPVIAALAAKVPFVLGGAVVVEQVFNWPGLGRLAWQAALDRDYPVIMGLALLAAAVARGAALVAALGQAALAPGARPGTAVDRPRTVRVPWGRRPTAAVGLALVVTLLAGCASRPRSPASGRPAVARAGRGAVAVELPAGWRPLGEAEIAEAFPHRSPTAETRLAAASGDGRFLVFVAADRKPSLVEFALREGLSGLRAALDAYLPAVIQAFEPVDAVDGGLAGRPALYYRFTGLASGAPTRQVRHFAMELVVVPDETALFTVSLLDLSGATRFTDPSLRALKAALRALLAAGGRPSGAPARHALRGPEELPDPPARPTGEAEASVADAASRRVREAESSAADAASPRAPGGAPRAPETAP